MTPPPRAPSQVLAATVDRCTMIAVRGAGNFRLAPAFRQAVQAARLAGTELIVVEMQACTALDSTFMGALAALGFSARDPNNPPAILINLPANLATLLTNLGIHRVLKSYSAGAFPEGLGDLSQFADNLQPVTGEPHSFQEMNALMFDAHETLTRVDPANIQRFKDVLALLRKDLGMPPAPPSGD